MHRTAAVAAVACAAGALAQPYIMNSSTIDGGGGRLTGPTYALSGTIGQHDAGVLEGATYTLNGGFWSTTGPIGCNLADLVEPFGILDLSDVIAFSGAMTTGDLIADIDDNGLLDLTDINMFVSSFLSGCP